MKKKIIILLICLSFFLLVSSVSATNESSSDSLKVGESSITVSTSEELINALENTDYTNIKLKNNTNFILNGSTINRDLTIESESTDYATIDGNYIEHIFYIPSNFKLTLNYIKLVNGAGYPDAGTFGGAIVADGTLIANNCIFEHNMVSSNGGAVIVEGHAANFTNCIFTNNYGNHGGGLYLYYNYGFTPTVYVKNCTFTDNNAEYGGGIYVMGGYLYVEDSTFQYNHATNYGSAIHVNKGFDSNGVTHLGYASVKNSSFLNNKVDIVGEYGGAISVFGKLTRIITTLDITDSYFESNTAEYGAALCGLLDSVINATNCKFVGNNATSYGGAIYSMDQLYLTNCIFQSNNGRQGGAISLYTNENNITNCTFIDNTATLSGGALRSSTDAYVSNSIFTGNTAPYGGALSAEGQESFFFQNKLTIENCTIKGNTAINLDEEYGGVGGGIYIQGACDVKYCIIEDNTAYYDGGGISINNNNNAVNITNNIIINNRANQEGNQIELESLDNVTLNNNWWGKNKIDTIDNLIKLYDNDTETYKPYTPYSWVVLNTLIENKTLNPTESTNIIAKFTNNWDEDLSIPEREIKFISPTGVLNPEITNIKDTTTVKYTAPLTSGIYNIETILDNEEEELTVTIGTLEVSYITTIKEEEITINQNEAITITVLADTTVNQGTIRLYNNGRTIGTGNVRNNQATIPETLEAGEYIINAYYIGEGIYENTQKDIKLIINPTNPTEINITNDTDTTPETETNQSTINTTEKLEGAYGESINFEGYLKNTKNEALMGHHVSLEFTRLSSGASKTYTVTTDYTGKYTIPITLAPGVYTIKTKYNGENGNPESNETITSLIIYSSDETPTNKTKTVLTLDTTNLNGENKNINGKLIDNLGKPIIGYHINVKLTRLSNGLSKIYTVTTDYTGTYTLPINLGNGQYQVDCTYDGTEVYTSSGNSRTITLQ